jgi:uncharacterized membrane protein YbhN (UPF0104 family)
MAVGATLAAAILVFYARHWMLLLIALGMMLAAGLPTVPPVFRRLVAAFQVHRANPRILELLDGLNYRLLARGWLVLCLAWLAYGLSLWATLMALPGVTAIPLDQLPLLTACVALAVVAGFLSLIPGGAGVRELVVTTLLAPMYGNAIAVSAAVLLRLIWLLSELVISSILYFADAFTGKRHVDVVDRRSNL